MSLLNSAVSEIDNDDTYVNGGVMTMAELDQSSPVLLWQAMLYIKVLGELRKRESAGLRWQVESKQVRVAYDVHSSRWQVESKQVVGRLQCAFI